MWTLWPIFKIRYEIFTIIITKKNYAFFGGGVILRGKQQIHKEEGHDRGHTGGAIVPLQSNGRPLWGKQWLDSPILYLEWDEEDVTDYVSIKLKYIINITKYIVNIIHITRFT